MRRILSILFLLLLLGLTPTAKANPPALDSYVVVLHDNVHSPAAAAREIAQFMGGQVGFIYEHALKGFSIRLPRQAVGVLQMNPIVKYVEIDTERHIFQQAIPTGIKRIFAPDNVNLSINSIDDWRVDVDVAVIDTGVDFDHPDLNVVGGINCAAGNRIRARCIEGGNDDHSHGTHVAGIIAAIDNATGVVGVAPGARIWAVKVLDSRGGGFLSWIIAGIDWVAANAEMIKVANMSLGGGGYSQAEFDAIQGAVNKGVAFAVSAGNSDADACYYSPAGFDNVLTVSALADFDGKPGGQSKATCREDQDDTLADFSNWGPCVDIAAPGVCILSTVPGGGLAVYSGTSMASPHVAGALALLASKDKPKNATDVNKLYNQVKNAGNLYWIDDSGDGSKEPLLDVSNTTLFNPALIPGSGGTPSSNNPPKAGFTYITDGPIVTFTDTSTDSDGTIASWRWSFGDGGTSTAQSPRYTYTGDGTYTVNLTVTDNDGATGTASQDVIVISSSGGGITLSVTARKVKGDKYADLTWSGATSPKVDVYRNDVIAATTENDGTHIDGPLGKGGGSAIYRVCEEATTTCSNAVSVSW